MIAPEQYSIEAGHGPKVDTYVIGKMFSRTILPIRNKRYEEYV